MTGLCGQVLMAWLLIYSYSFAGAHGYQELGRALRHRSPIDIVVPDANVVQCVLGLSQAYHDWYGWVSLSCKGVSTSSSTSAGSSTPVGPSTMAASASSRIAVRAVNFVVPLLLSIIYGISGG
jgi:hypothetical protein